ncbi:ankyrin repeat-containing domain protein [Microdochium bolleyi]|uniref:Ankyrin repeat-containing domain protein n=1 Tax=Microdochium bolleyi TaxID=196109 RepID=A0A136ITB0_9PEZI|nr:ankyrin repeat-containing domain protein [Microdochium bolleyi]
MALAVPPAQGPWEDDAVILNREDVLAFNEDNILPLPAYELADLRAWLRPTDYESEDIEIAKLKEAHLEGAGRWLPESAAYRNWHSSGGDEKALLWISGTGKSVLAASLIQRLREESVPVLCFFVRQPVAANRTPAAALRAGLAQLLPYSPPLQAKMKCYRSAGRAVDALTTADLWRKLQACLRRFPMAYVVVDALDAMDRGGARRSTFNATDNDDDEIRAFLAELTKLSGCCQPAKIKVAITSRPVAAAMSALQVTAGHDAIVDIMLEKEALATEGVADYVREHLARPSSTISTENQALINAVVPGRSNGSYIFAKLAMDRLTRPGADVPTVLEQLPQNLDAMYAGLLREHTLTSGVDKDTHLLILQLIAHAMRPLSLREIASVLDVVARGSAHGEVRDPRTSKDLVRAACGPLLQILPDETGSVVHHSFAEFLTSGHDHDGYGADGAVGDADPGMCTLEAGAAHMRISLACLEYLKEKVLGKPYVRPGTATEVEDTFVRYAGTSWFVHAGKATAAGYTNHAELVKVLDGLFASTELKSEILTRSYGGPSIMDYMFGSSKYAPPTPRYTPVYMATVLQLRTYLEVLLSRNSEVNQGTNPGKSPLCAASSTGDAEFVEVLLQAGADPEECDTVQYSGLAPLHYAVKRNDVVVAKLLLEGGASPITLTQFEDPSCHEHRDISPLEWACTRGHPASLLEVFLPHISSTQVLGQAVLWIVPTGRADLLDVVLSHPLAAQLRNSEVRGVLNTALFRASAERDAPMVRALLLAGADASALGTSPETAFFEIRWARLEIGPLHAWAAADLDVSNEPGSAHAPRSSWPRLEELGYQARGSMTDTEKAAAAKEVFEMLVAAGADVHQRTATLGSTPLHYARDVVAARLLVEVGGADLRLANARGETLLGLTRDRATVEFILGEIERRTGSTGDHGQHEEPPDATSAMLDRMQPDWRGRQDGADIAEQVLVFLDYGADPAQAVSEGGQTMLHLLVQLDINTGGDKRQKDDNGGGGDKVTDSRVALLQRLVRCPGMHANLRNAKGQTPLHLLSLGELSKSFRNPTGALESNRGLLDGLLAAGADLEALDDQGRSPLFYRIDSYRHWPSFQDAGMITMCEAMVRAGSRLDTRDAWGRTLLHAAVARGSSGPLVKWLCDQGADALAVDNNGNTLFHPALTEGHLPKHIFSEDSLASGLLGELLRQGADPTRPNHAGTTPLHIASTITPSPFEIHNGHHSQGTTTVFDWFLQRQRTAGNVDVADQNGVTPLHNAATLSEYIARRLLDAGADPLRETNEGLNGLHLAARARQANVLGMMLEKITVPSASDAGNSGVVGSHSQSHPRSPLFYAVASGRPESVALLLEAAASVSSVVYRPSTEYQNSPLQAAVQFEEELANWPNTVKRQGHYGVREVGSVLLNDKFRMAEKPGPRPSERLDEILDLLQEHDLVARDHIDMAVAEAAEKGAAYTLTCLLRMREHLLGEEGRLANRAAGECGPITALVEAREQSRQLFVDAIAAQGTLSPDEFDAAMRARHFDVVADGLSTPDSSLQILHDPSQGCNGTKTLLQYLAAGGHAALLAKETQACTDYLGGEIEPLLVTACRRELPNMEVVRLLVEQFGVDINAVGGGGDPRGSTSGKANIGASALHVLATGGHWWQISQGLPYLLSRGAKVDIVAAATQRGWGWSRGGRGYLMTPLNAALDALPRRSILTFSRRVVEMLLEYGANVTTMDDRGVSCLDRAKHDPEIHALLLRYARE